MEGGTPIYPETHEFIEHTNQSFALEGLVQVAKCGDQLIKAAGSLGGACRSFQEFFTQRQEQLVRNINLHLEGSPELRGDLAEIHRIGAIPRYRGPLPPEERVRGLPHNPAEATLMMTKLWNYVVEGKNASVRCGGVTPGGEIPLFSVDYRS